MFWREGKDTLPGKGVEPGYGLSTTTRPQGSGAGQRNLAEGKGSLFAKAVVAVWAGRPGEGDAYRPGRPTRFISTVDCVEPGRVRAVGGPTTPLGFENSGHPGRVVVLLWAPVVRGFEVQQRLNAHRSDGFESTGHLTTGFLDEGHVGFVRAITGG